MRLSGSHQHARVEPDCLTVLIAAFLSLIRTTQYMEFCGNFDTAAKLTGPHHTWDDETWNRQRAGILNP